MLLSLQLGDNCIQNFHLWRYIVGYTVGNLVLRRRVSGAVKRDFRTYIRRYTSPNENFEYGYPHSNALLTIAFKKTVKMYFVAHIHPAAASCIKPLGSCIYSLVNQWKATLRNDIGFATVYRRIYCRKFMTLSNQTSRCICKCIRMPFEMNIPMSDSALRYAIKSLMHRAKKKLASSDNLALFQYSIRRNARVSFFYFNTWLKLTIHRLKYFNELTFIVYFFPLKRIPQFCLIC